MEFKEAYAKIKLWQIAFIVVALMLICGLYFFGLDPSKKMLERRNAQRRNDVTNILNAVYRYNEDHKDANLEGLTEVPKIICRTAAKSCDGMVDISPVIANEKYLLSEVPIDVNEKAGNASGYLIYKSKKGRISVEAVNAENAKIILSK